MVGHHLAKAAACNRYSSLSQTTPFHNSCLFEGMSSEKNHTDWWVLMEPSSVWIWAETRAKVSERWMEGFGGTQRSARAIRWYFRLSLRQSLPTYSLDRSALDASWVLYLSLTTSCKVALFPFYRWRSRGSEPQLRQLPELQASLSNFQAL